MQLMKILWHSFHVLCLKTPGTFSNQHSMLIKGTMSPFKEQLHQVSKG